MHGMRANADRQCTDAFRQTAHCLSVVTARSWVVPAHTGGVRSGSAVWKSGCSMHVRHPTHRQRCTVEAWCQDGSTHARSTAGPLLRTTLAVQRGAGIFETSVTAVWPPSHDLSSSQHRPSRPCLTRMWLCKAQRMGCWQFCSHTLQPTVQF